MLWCVGTMCRDVSGSDVEFMRPSLVLHSSQMALHSSCNYPLQANVTATERESIHTAQVDVQVCLPATISQLSNHYGLRSPWPQNALQASLAFNVILNILTVCASIICKRHYFQMSPLMVTDYKSTLSNPLSCHKY